MSDDGVSFICPEGCVGVPGKGAVTWERFTDGTVEFICPDCGTYMVQTDGEPLPGLRRQVRSADHAEIVVREEAGSLVLEIRAPTGKVITPVTLDRAGAARLAHLIWAAAAQLKREAR